MQRTVPCRLCNPCDRLQAVMTRCSFLSFEICPFCSFLSFKIVPFCSFLSFEIFPFCSFLSLEIFPFCSFLSLEIFPFCSFLSSEIFPFCSYLSLEIFLIPTANYIGPLPISVSWNLASLHSRLHWPIPRSYLCNIFMKAKLAHCSFLPLKSFHQGQIGP